MHGDRQNLRLKPLKGLGREPKRCHRMQVDVSHSTKNPLAWKFRERLAQSDTAPTLPVSRGCATCVTRGVCSRDVWYVLWAIGSSLVTERVPAFIWSIPCPQKWGRSKGSYSKSQGHATRICGLGVDGLPSRGTGQAASALQMCLRTPALRSTPQARAEGEGQHPCTEWTASSHTPQ